MNIGVTGSKVIASPSSSVVAATVPLSPTNSTSTVPLTRDTETMPQVNTSESSEPKEKLAAPPQTLTLASEETPEGPAVILMESAGLTAKIWPPRLRMTPEEVPSLKSLEKAEGSVSTSAWMPSLSAWNSS